MCVVFFETSEYDKAPKKAVQSANNKIKNINTVTIGPPRPTLSVLRSVNTVKCFG